MALVKGKATASAGKSNDPPRRSCAEVVAALEAADASVRRDAVRAISGCADAVGVLIDHLRRETNTSVREVILTTLVRLNDPSVGPGLANLLRSEDAALRNEVIESLQQMGDAVAPLLDALITDPDPDVRIFVINILDSEHCSNVEARLIAVITHDAHVNVCAAAVDLLCEVGSEAAIEPLAHLKSRFPSEAYIQFAVDLALKRIRET